MQSSRFVIHGPPISKKNNWHVGRSWHGGTRIIKSTKLREWEEDAQRQIKAQMNGSNRHIGGELAVDICVYLAKRQRLDLDNALAGPFDALQAAGVIANDYQIKELHACLLRDWDNPRVEIELRRIEGGML